MTTSSPQIKTQASTPNIADLPMNITDGVLPSTEDKDAPLSSYADPSLFTFVPQLYLVISRLSELRNPPPSVTANGTSDLTHTTSRDSNLSLRQTTSETQNTIEARDLPQHIYGIRKGIEKAKDVVHGLPDIDRSVEQQEQEIKDLENSIRGLQRRLKELGRIAGQSNDIVMEGTEHD